MAVSEGRITAVGSDAHVRRVAGPDADVVDLDGATVLPGFIDTGTDWGFKNVLEHLALAAEPRYGATGRRAATAGISRADALATWTRTAAQVLGWKDIGSLVAGHHADMIIVDRNPMTCPIAELPDTRVHVTMLGGCPVSGSIGDGARTTSSD